MTSRGASRRPRSARRSARAVDTSTTLVSSSQPRSVRRAVSKKITTRIIRPLRLWMRPWRARLDAVDPVGLNLLKQKQAHAVLGPRADRLGDEGAVHLGRRGPVGVPDDDVERRSLRRRRRVATSEAAGATSSVDGVPSPSSRSPVAAHRPGRTMSARRRTFSRASTSSACASEASGSSRPGSSAVKRRASWSS